MSVRLRRRGAAIGLLLSVGLLAAQPALAGDGTPTPSADELWRTYPLHPTVSPTPTRAGDAAAPAAGHDRGNSARLPAARSESRGERSMLLLLILPLLAAAIAFGSRARRRRRRAAHPGAAPPRGVPARSLSVWSGPGGERPARAPPAGEAVDAPTERFGRITQHPPWPKDTEDRWRCELTLNADPLSSRFQAIAYPPGGGRGSAIGTSPASTPKFANETDWQSPERLELAVQTLASALVTEGWEPVGEGAGWYARRFCWPREEPPPQRVEPVPTSSGVS
jgi:hypothetical protein